jgi:hypothetical protein
MNVRLILFLLYAVPIVVGLAALFYGYFKATEYERDTRDLRLLASPYGGQCTGEECLLWATTCAGTRWKGYGDSRC